MNIEIPLVSEMIARGEEPEVVFWVGCAGSFDDRAKRVTKDFAKLLHSAGVKFACLGVEETCTGDPAKRAGNDFLFQMQAFTNIQTLNGYGVKRIVTACPHCFNTLKNEYPALGGNYEVIHHTEFLQKLLDEGRLTIEGGAFKGKKITYHDSCYLGRANEIYEAPRNLIAALEADFIELKRCKTNGLCCGAGGAQMFKEAEKGNKEINVERTEEILDFAPEYVAVACPFCKTMLKDGVNVADAGDRVKVLDVAEILARAKGLTV